MKIIAPAFAVPLVFLFERLPKLRIFLEQRHMIRLGLDNLPDRIGELQMHRVDLLGLLFPSEKALKGRNKIEAAFRGLEGGIKTVEGR